ncbi:HGxxPAAW family protein [Kribbella deserti]|uniref:HGxxPAAW family protein n=1 Tax=Kribbella deserti TaxID=1926257 RepID=A0ABV6QKL7_9ACTN
MGRDDHEEQATMDKAAEQTVTTPASTPTEDAHDHHGNTPAAWTAVVILLIAFTLGAIAIVLGPNWVLFWASVALAAVGALIGKVLQLLGFGTSRH